MKKAPTNLEDAIKYVAQGETLTIRAKRARGAIVLADRRLAKIVALEAKTHGLENQLRCKSLDVRTHFDRAAELERKLRGGGEPIPMRLVCPRCGTVHVDEGEFATKVHHTHACQECGEVWRPAVVPTVGVRFLPGFKDLPKGPTP